MPDYLLIQRRTALTRQWETLAWIKLNQGRIAEVITGDGHLLEGPEARTGPWGNLLGVLLLRDTWTDRTGRLYRRRYVPSARYWLIRRRAKRC
ncbi:MAG: hypothetical protein ACE5JP_14870 [Candidatus Bipolaricaulia bacterium]